MGQAICTIRGSKKTRAHVKQIFEWRNFAGKRKSDDEDNDDHDPNDGTVEQLQLPVFCLTFE